MQRSRLYELFQALAPADLKVLRKFVRSPFVNQRRHVVQLYDFLEQARKSGASVDRRLAFAHLWPELEFDHHKLRLSMSLLLKVMERYLIGQQVAQQPVAERLHLARAYGQLGLERHFNSSMKAIAQMQEEQAFQNAVYFENQHQFYLEQYQFNSRHNRMEELPLGEVQANFDIAYLAAKLKQSCLILSHQTIYKKDYDFGMLPEALAYIERNHYLQYPAISVYYYAYQALSREEEREDYFSTFKALIFQHQQLFPQEEIRNLFLLATNYCIQQLNKGISRYAQEGLDIYKEGLKNDILLQNGLLSNFTYSNIVAKAIVSKDFAWAAQFVHQYRGKLEPRFQESNYAYNLAWLKYEQQEYEEALDLLHQSNFTDVLLNLSAKTMALKIYYELAAFDLLHAHLDAMRSFLRRKKILAYHQENYANTIRYTKRLLDTPAFAKEKRQKLKEEIQATQSVAEKKWLLAQL